jgi:hypothetical protein
MALAARKRPEFPDRVLSPVEIRASLKGELCMAKQKFYLLERWSRTERVEVEAMDEEEAEDLYLAGGYFPSETIYDDECDDYELLSPSDEHYPS